MIVSKSSNYTYNSHYNVSILLIHTSNITLILKYSTPIIALKKTNKKKNTRAHIQNVLKKVSILLPAEEVVLIHVFVIQIKLHFLAWECRENHLQNE